MVMAVNMMRTEELTREWVYDEANLIADDLDGLRPLHASRTSY